MSEAADDGLSKNTLPADLEETVRHLNQEFPNLVNIIDPGTQLYRMTDNPELVASLRRFDPNRARGGRYYFIDVPVEGDINLAASPSHHLLLLDTRKNGTNEIDRELLARLRQNGPDPAEAMKGLGFNGFIGAGTSMYVPEGAREIVIFPESLPAFDDNIHEYKADSTA